MVAVSSLVMPVLALLNVVALLFCDSCGGGMVRWIFPGSIAGWVLALALVIGMARAMRRGRFGWLWRGVAVMLLIGFGGAGMGLAWVWFKVGG